MTARARLLSLAAGAAAAALAAVGAAAPAQAAPDEDDCSVEYEVVTGGDGGFNAYVWVDNHADEPAYWEASLYYGGAGPDLSYWTGPVDVETLGSLVLVRSAGTIDEDRGWAKLIGRGLSKPAVVEVRCQDTPFA